MSVHVCVSVRVHARSWGVPCRGAPLSAATLSPQDSFSSVFHMECEELERGRAAGAR